MAFVPYADPNLAAATVGTGYQQNSIAPFRNDAAGIQAAVATPGYTVPGINAALALQGSGPAPAPANPNAGAIAQTNTQIGQLDGQQRIGMENIGNSYNDANNRLDEQYGVAQRNYNTGTQQNTQSYSNNRSGIMNNTRAQANALQRLLGINGSGNSSAAYEQAPYAAGLYGSQQLNQAQNAFSQNQGQLDTSWQDTERSQRTARGDIESEKYRKENGLKSSIAQARVSMLERLQQLQGDNSQSGAINDLLGQITEYGRQYREPVTRSTDISFTNPTLKNYFLNNNQQQAAAGGGGAASDLNPAFLGMLGGQRDEYGNLIS